MKKITLEEFKRIYTRKNSNLQTEEFNKLTKSIKDVILKDLNLQEDSILDDISYWEEKEIFHLDIYDISPDWNEEHNPTTITLERVIILLNENNNDN